MYNFIPCKSCTGEETPSKHQMDEGGPQFSIPYRARWFQVNPMDEML